MQQLTASEQYLQSTVMTASPAKLRLMLIERGLAVVEAIKETRRKNPDRLVDEWTLRLRDILGELLQGVTRGAGDLARQIADIYVFMISELTFAEQEPGNERLEAIGRILEIERETWTQVCKNQLQDSAAKPNTPHFPNLGAQSPSAAPAVGSLNLQG